MKRVLWGLEAVLLLLLLLFLTNHISNEWMIRQYSQNNYKENDLSFLGFWQPYVSAYNKGIIDFQKEDYAGAIEHFEKARRYYPSREYDCNIRINECLAMLATFDENAVTVDNYDKQIDFLESVKVILCERGCAEMEGNSGHNADAQQLRVDIDECIKRLGAKIKFIKNDENGKTLEGATLQVLNSDKQVMYEWISEEEPYTQIRFVAGQTYIFRELTAPDGYTKAKDISFTINEDNTVSYETKIEGSADDEVIMINQKESQSGGGSEGEEQESEEKDEKDESDDDQELKQELQEIQKDGQTQRIEEINEQNAEFEFYNGATW